MADNLKPIVVKIAGKDPYERLLVPGKDTVKMKSGCVTLSPGAYVGEHNTDEKEETLFILSGEAEIICEGRGIKAVEGDLFYVPPHTRHDVKNTGKDILRYIFLVVPVLA